MRKKCVVFVLIVILSITIMALTLVSCDDASNKFTVTFVADDQIVATVKCKKDSKTVEMPGVPPKYGYTGYWENFTLNGEDITVKAIYILKQFTVKLNYNEAESCPVETLSFTFNKSVGSLPEPQKSNYYFDGWYWGNTRITSDYVWNTDVNDDIVLNAKWVPASGGITLEFKYDPSAYCVVRVATNATDVVVPSSYNGYTVTSIDNQAFAYCVNLKSVSIPASVSSIGNISLFGYSDNIESITIHPDNKYYYSEGNCIINKSTNELVAGTCLSVIPNNVLCIGQFAFAKVGFSTFSIPQGVQDIQDFAFCGCRNLISIYIPSSILSLGSHVFIECERLTTIYYGGTKVQWLQIARYVVLTQTTALKQVVCANGTIEY